MIKLAISNIAWPLDEDYLYLELVRKNGFCGLEIAPSRVWPKPELAESGDVRAYKNHISNHGLEIPAMQALLYGRPDLGLMRDHATETRTIKYLKHLCDIAAILEARILVFGSPANRSKGELELDTALERAAEFFSPIADYAASVGVCLCIEPLRPEEADFINTANEGLRLVRMVNSPGFGLHLDAKAVAAESLPAEEVINASAAHIEHFHINDPGLVEVDTTGAVNHKILGQCLRDAGYRNSASIEMRQLPDYHNAVVRSLGKVKKYYGG